jgi:Rieske Fe-S protein
MTTDGLSRRHALTGAVTVGLGAPLLAACGDDGDETATEPGGESSSPSDAASSGSGGGGGAAALAATSDIEVGGGTIFADERVVVTQPTEGEFKGFSSTCTHQGCQVSSVADGTINCTCHGSQFSIEDGSVDEGPATKGLSEKTVTVTGDSLTVS